MYLYIKHALLPLEVKKAAIAHQPIQTIKKKED